jgi:hypothetical protein
VFAHRISCGDSERAQVILVLQSILAHPHRAPLAQRDVELAGWLEPVLVEAIIAIRPRLAMDQLTGAAATNRASPVRAIDLGRWFELPSSITAEMAPSRFSE